MQVAGFTLYESAKAAEVGQAAAKLWDSPPLGSKPLASYTFQGIPFHGTPMPEIGASRAMNTTIWEVENNDALSIASLQIQAAVPVVIWWVPVLEMSIPNVIEQVNKLGA